jgi:hypothetical protein
MEETHGFDFAGSSVEATGAAVLEAQGAALREGEKDGVEIGGALRVGGRPGTEHGLFEDLELTLTIAREDSPDFPESRGHVGGESGAGELVDEQAGGGESGGFIGGECDRGEEEALQEGVTDAGFGDDRDSNLAERSDVAINAAEGDVKVFSDVLGTRNAAALEINDQREETIDAGHAAKLHTATRTLK